MIRNKKIMIKFKSLLIAGLLISVIMSSCKKDSSSKNSISNVYISGYLDTLIAESNGTFWQDSVAYEVPGTSQINAVIVQDNNIYLLDATGYWKNDTYYSLQDAAGTFSFFISGDDVYVTGYSTTSRNTATAAAVYWKNGQLVNLTQSVAEVTAASANSIYVSGNDVYVAGIIGINYRDEYAVYWKNGVMQTITDGYDAKLIAVSGNDVYIAGTSLNNGDVYWKNGTEQTLGNAFVNAMTVYNGDVYIAGFTNYGPDQAVYWKNGTAVVLPNGSSASGIAVSGSDVYVSGNGGSNNAVYWKNGVINILGVGGTTGIAVGN
jgi:hypothetical protein